MTRWWNSRWLWGEDKTSLDSAGELWWRINKRLFGWTKGLKWPKKWRLWL